MQIEHAAWMVEDPLAVADWYAANLGFRVARKMDEPPFTHFLVDGAGRAMIEFYNNPSATVPDYRRQDSLVLHLAFSVDDIEANRDRLVGAGASVEVDVTSIPSGDRICMLRDPWGFAVQLVSRRVPLLD